MCGDICFPARFPEVAEASHEESLKIAADYLRRALKELAEGDTSHADVWINDALLWMGQR